MLDEPAGGVNPALIDRIADLVRELNAEGRTFIIVEHNMELVMSLSDHVVVFDRGRPIARAPPTVVQADPRCWRHTSASELVPAEAPATPHPPRVLLELGDVEAGYGRAALVLRGLSVTVPAGTVVCLVGPNGAGKSTVLKVASGCSTPRSGHGPGRRRGRHRTPPAAAARRRAGPRAAGAQRVPRDDRRGERPARRVHRARQGAWSPSGSSSCRSCSRSSASAGAPSPGCCRAASRSRSSSPAR